MQNVIDYSLIESDDQAELVEAVMEARRTDGWQPQGGVCIWFEPPGILSPSGIIHYAQALVKYAED